jgi:hypothetical protein
MSSERAAATWAAQLPRGLRSCLANAHAMLFYQPAPLPHPAPLRPAPPQATLAAANVAGVLQGFGAWSNPNDITPFLDGPIASLPRAAPSIVNAKDVGLPTAA